MSRLRLVPLLINIPIEIRTRAKIAAARRRMTLTQFVINAINERLTAADVGTSDVEA